MASNAYSAISGATSGIPSWLKNPLMSAGKAMLTGGNPLTAALGSGIGELGSSIGGLAEMPQLGRFVANQGYGMFLGSQAASRAQEAAMRRYLSRRTFPQRRLV